MVRKRWEEGGLPHILADMSVGYGAIRETFTTRVVFDAEKHTVHAANPPGQAAAPSRRSRTAGRSAMSRAAATSISRSLTPSSRSCCRRWWGASSTRCSANIQKLSRPERTRSMAGGPPSERIGMKHALAGLLPAPTSGKRRSAVREWGRSGPPRAPARSHAGFPRRNDAVVPQARGAVVGMAFALVSLEHGALKAASSSALHDLPSASILSRRTVARTLAACTPPMTETRALGHVNMKRGPKARPHMA